MDVKVKNKKGQMVIWAIVAIAIVAIIIFVSMIAFKPKIISPIESNPQAFVQKCVRDATLEAVDKMLPQGGFVNPANYKLWHNTKVEYICQNLGSYYPCINQHPMFLNDEKSEIYNYILPRVENCFEQLKTEGAKLHQTITLGGMNLSVSLAPGLILVDINRKTTISNKGENIFLEKYNVKMESSLYDLANVAMDIATSQGKYCYFEYNGYTILYPKWDISVDTMSDSTKIYTIKDTYSGKIMNIAIRGCAVPPGGV